MITRTVSICGKDVTFGASALVPKIYRNYYARYILQDIKKLQKKIQVSNENFDEEADESALSAMDLNIFERIAWTMAYHADKDGTFPKTPDEWLEGFDGIFSIYDVFPVILDLWGFNTETIS